MKGDMDLSVLPNNNHPEKFLQLDVKSLMRSSTLLQASLARFPGGHYPATQHWQNLVYSQAPWDICHEIIQSQRHSNDYNPGASQRKSVSGSEKAAREKNIATQRIKGFGGENPVLPESPPASMSSVMKNNPLYGDVSLEEAMEERKKNPSWTIEEYDKHSVHTNLSGHLKENPNDLRFWLGDMYTPGFDTLLKKKKKRNKRSKLCHMGLILLVVSCILVTIVTLSTIFS